MSTMLFFFAAGLWLLRYVDEKKGCRESGRN
jgi:hypothetical protein